MQKPPFSDVLVFLEKGKQPKEKKFEITGNVLTKDDIKVLEFFHLLHKNKAIEPDEMSVLIDQLKKEYWPFASSKCFQEILKHASLHLCTTKIKFFAEGKCTYLPLVAMINADSEEQCDFKIPGENFRLFVSE